MVGQCSGGSGFAASFGVVFDRGSGARRTTSRDWLSAFMSMRTAKGSGSLRCATTPPRGRVDAGDRPRPLAASTVAGST